MTALCAPETAGRGKIRFLVSDPARAKEALKTARYRVGEEEAVTVRLENRPGTFAGLAEQLAQARINIKCAYVTGEAGTSLSSCPWRMPRRRSGCWADEAAL